jgi:hypothetical protein
VWRTAKSSHVVARRALISVVNPIILAGALEHTIDRGLIIEVHLQEK